MNELYVSLGVTSGWGHSSFFSKDDGVMDRKHQLFSHKKSDKSDCQKHLGIILLSVVYKILTPLCVLA